jgi:hypothetical protein
MRLIEDLSSVKCLLQIVDTEADAEIAYAAWDKLRAQRAPKAAVGVVVRPDGLGRIAYIICTDSDRLTQGEELANEDPGVPETSFLVENCQTDQSLVELLAGGEMSFIQRLDALMEELRDARETGNVERRAVLRERLRSGRF